MTKKSIPARAKHELGNSLRCCYLTKENKMKKVIRFLFAALFGMATGAHAHSIWINSFESHAHQPPHTMVALGWGHSLPLDDILTSPNSRIVIERFELFDPGLKRTGLIKPEFKISSADLTTKNFEVFPPDLGIRNRNLLFTGMDGERRNRSRTFCASSMTVFSV
jgi:hypothetical protein